LRERDHFATARGASNLGKLVGLLDRLPVDTNSPQLGEVTLLVDVFAYLTCFPDVRHHPVEDQIVASLLAKNALSADIAEEIDRQHRVLARQGTDLMRDLESAAREETTSWHAAVVSARLYAERLRHNMAVEELAVFPAAEQRLGDADWHAIAALSTQAPSDPLFVSRTEKRFADLRRVIATEADCGCFENPEVGR
jgi:hemerythrin-like domain-containing protein